MLIGAVNELLKVYYKEGRPYYLQKDNTIQPFDCEDKDFGSPSGHILSSACILILIYLQYFDPHDIRGSAELVYRRFDKTYDEAGRDEYQHPRNRRSPTAAKIGMAILAVVMIFGWIHELISGGNSLDQIVFGTSLGFGMVFTWYLMRNVVSIFFLKVSEQVDDISEKIRVIVFGVVAILVAILLGYLCRWYTIREFNIMDDVPPEWVLEYERECGRVQHPAWFYLHLQNIYRYLLFFLGTSLGVVFDSLVLGGTIVTYNKTHETDTGE